MRYIKWIVGIAVACLVFIIVVSYKIVKHMFRLMDETMRALLR